MKIKNIFVGLILMTLTFTSCNSWFDVSSSTIVKGKDIFKTEQGFKDVFTGVYTLMTTKHLYGRDLSYGYNDARARYWEINSIEHDYYKATNNDYTDKDEEKRILNLWNTLYKAISNINSIIENIDNDESIFAPNMHSLYKGEAFALRAMLHFELLRLFGVSPSVPNAMETKSIPYYVIFTNIAQPILTMGNVIDKIREDIHTARQLMVNVDPYGPNHEDFDKEYVELLDRVIKMNYWATTALLARMELYAGNKDAALAAAKEIIGEVNSTPKRPFNINEDGTDKLFKTEAIFSLKIASLKDIKDNYLPENVAEVKVEFLLSMAKGTSDEIYSNISATDAEYRKGLWIKKSNETSSTLAKYDEEKNIPMFKLSELYYIASECVEDSSIAYDYLNNIRGGRGLAPVSSDIEYVIQSEYQKEFIGEGQLFYFYKRKGLTNIGFNSDKIITLSEYLLPLPSTEVEFGKVE